MIPLCCGRLSVAAALVVAALAAPASGQLVVEPNLTPADLPLLVRAAVIGLYSQSPQERMASAFRLGEMGPRAQSAIPFLIGLLGDHGPWNTGKMYVWQPPDVPFGELVTSPGREAAKALARVGRAAVDPLLQVATDAKAPSAARENAAWALGQIGYARAAGPLIAAAKGKQVRGDWLDALGRLGDPNAVGVLLDALANPWAQMDAVAALIRIGPPVVGPLAAAMPDALKGGKDSAGTAAGIAEALGGISVAEPNVIAALGEAMGSPLAGVRYKSAEALARLAGPRAVELLRPALSDADWQVRKVAVQALAAAKEPKDYDAVAGRLADEDMTVRGWAVAGLGQWGDKKAIQKLRPMLGDDSVFVRCQAIGALAALGDQESAKAIAGLLTSDEIRLRRSAAAAMAVLKNPDTIDALASVMLVEDKFVREPAQAALAGIGPPAAELVIQRLRELPELSSANADRGELTGILTAMGPAGLAKVIPLLAEPDWRMRSVGAGVCQAVGMAAVPALIDALGDKALARPAAEQLKKITEQDFGPDADKWRQWLRQKEGK